MCLSAIRNRDIWTVICLGYCLPILIFFISMENIQIHSLNRLVTREINYIGKKIYSFKSNFFSIKLYFPSNYRLSAPIFFSVQKHLFSISTMVRNIFLSTITLFLLLFFTICITYTHPYTDWDISSKMSKKKKNANSVRKWIIPSTGPKWNVFQNCDKIRN